MIVKDLQIKRKGRPEPKLKSLERNPNNNFFLVIGTNYLKIQELTKDNTFKEKELFSQNKRRVIKYAKWGKKKEDALYYFELNDSNNYNLNSLNIELNKSMNIFTFENEIKNCSINCDDSLMVCCSDDDLIYLLDLNNKTIIKKISRNNNWTIKDCQFSPINDNYFLVSGDGGNIYLYDKRNLLKHVKNFFLDSKEILSVAWHPYEQNKFCSGGMDNLIRIWDINDNMSSLVDFKTSEGCSKVKFLKSKPNYIFSSYQTNNFNIHLWNIKLRDLPEYRFSGHDSTIIGLDNDFEGNKIVSLDKKGLLIAHEVDKGERIFDNITTNIITFNNKNELYCFHDEKLQKEDFSKKNIQENNNIVISKEKTKENINNIYMLNFNQKEMQIMNKSPSKTDKLIHLKNNTILILKNELSQYYTFTPEQICFLFRGYIYYIEKKESLYKRTRFQSVSDLYKSDKYDDPITIDNLDFPQKLTISISKNLAFATNHVKNYNHISIWKTLLNITEKPTFKIIFNKFIGKEQKKKKDKNLNRSFERLKGNLETNYLKKISPVYLELMTNIVINQLSKIIDYLIDDYGDLILATIICYLFKPILFHDEKLKTRILRLIKDCVFYLRKYQLYVEANHLIKYGPKENNNIDEKNFKFTYNFKAHEKENVKEGIFCEECEKITSGLFLWFPSCGHEEHLIHINKNKSEYFCNDCKKKN